MKALFLAMFVFVVSGFCTSNDLSSTSMELTSLVVVDAYSMLPVSGHKYQKFQQIMC